VLLDIAGLQYIPTYLDGATHDRLLAAVDEQPWLRSADRGVQVYGYSYHRASDTAFPVGPLPAWATDLAVRLCHDGLMPSVPDQLVVNDYPEGAGIFSHVDQSVFGATIASVSLGSTCVMQFVHIAARRRFTQALSWHPGMGSCPHRSRRHACEPEPEALGSTALRRRRERVAG